jgi:hypothetical protein
MFLPHSVNPGANVMIAIFGVFDRFLAKNWRFSENKDYESFFALTSSVLSQQRQCFRQYVWRKYF